MNRRVLIKRLFLVTTGVAVTGSGYTWLKWHIPPDIVFLEREKKLLFSLAETILPETNCPGAGIPGISEFIIIMIRDCSSRVTQNRFITELKDLKLRCKIQYGKYFEFCSTEEKQEILDFYMQKNLDYSGILGKIQRKFFGKSFFNTLKEYTVKGFCLSKVGATEALVYLPVPTMYSGCKPMITGQRAWALN